ncbi:MAG: hypothetical protein COT74_09555 [Bdellovibrionales bacterium CG10_big_fil_rev_8_21_14_0_10_45_34]|nr:MAG: hypothetical protein COT74_09555 [Bdellovibrionales bacterium CG10_big_fil_rev_8_21_14_0_10_45_34]
MIIEVDGKKVSVTSLRTSGGIWVHYDGVTALIKEDGPKRKSAGAGAAGIEDGNITSPMPGKIIKVNIKEGQTVRAGDSLLTLNAMKMEYVISAPTDGSVKELFVEEGQTVALGAALVHLQIKEK